MLKGHVLVMKFLGTPDGWPYPKLKEVQLSDGTARELYMECVLVLRKLYMGCKLVHADLSEYNMLYGDGTLYIIDVSQSVEHEHPQALEFLRKDCTNITEFFRKKDVHVMTTKELFDFVTDPTITSSNIDQYIYEAQQRASSRDLNDKTADEEVSEAVFKNVFIPRSLNEVVRFEKDKEDIESGQKLDIAYQTVTGLKLDLSGPQHVPQLLQDKVKEDSLIAETTPSLSGSETGSSSDFSDKDVIVDRQEKIRQRKAHKQSVKEENREKRKHKIPKHVKKRKEKLIKQKNKSK
jgi:RIO kinase 1